MADSKEATERPKQTELVIEIVLQEERQGRQCCIRFDVRDLD